MTYYIYTLQNKINLKIYVGKTHNPEKRFKEHSYVASGNTESVKFLIHRAIIKYGIDNFLFAILEEFENEQDCFDAEKFWIEFLRTNVYRYGRDCGYNLTDGGDGASGQKMSQEAKNKISEANKGRIRSPETRRKMRESHLGKSSGMLGKHHSDEKNKKQSEMVSGEKNYFYGKKFNGDKNPSSKLTEKQVIEIIELFKNETYNQTIIAKMYNVTLSTINKIKTGRSWNHLPR